MLTIVISIKYLSNVIFLVIFTNNLNLNNIRNKLNKQKMEIDQDSFIEECNNLPQSINHNSCPLCKKMKEHETFNNHLRNCKSLNLLINRTYSVCKYSCLHIIRTKYLEKHEKICTYNCK